MIVIDASLAVKLYLDEPGSEEAIVLMESSDGEISAPDLLVVEVASALVRRANIDKHVGDAMQRKLASFAELASGGAIRLTRASPLDIGRAANGLTTSPRAEMTIRRRTADSAGRNTRATAR